MVSTNGTTIVKSKIHGAQFQHASMYLIFEAVMPPSFPKASVVMIISVTLVL